MPVKRKTWVTKEQVSEYEAACITIERLCGWRLVKERNETGRINLLADTGNSERIDLALGVSADTASEIVYAIEAAAEAAATHARPRMGAE